MTKRTPRSLAGVDNDAGGSGNGHRNAAPQPGDKLRREGPLSPGQIPTPDTAGIVERLNAYNAALWDGETADDPSCVLMAAAASLIQSLADELAVWKRKAGERSSKLRAALASIEVQDQRIRELERNMNRIIYKDVQAAFEEGKAVSKARIERLTAALEWYADPAHYDHGRTGHPFGVICDKGWRARAALKE